MEMGEVRMHGMEDIRCRTCMFASDKLMCFTQISQLCYPERTVKNILIQMVPQMENTLIDEDRICRTCLKTVIAYARFVTKCLDIEAQLEQDNAQLEKVLESDEWSPQIDEEDFDEDGVQIVENIEIVVENDQEKSLNQDHLYIKSEQDDTRSYDLDFEMSLEEAEEEEEEEEEEHEHEEEDDGEEMVRGASATSNDYDSIILEQEMIEGDEELNDETHATIFTDDGRVVRIKQEVMDEDSKSMMEVFVDADTVICEICGNLVRANELQRHVANHDSYKCNECGKKFKSKNLLKNHIAAVHEPDIVGFRYQCTECDKLFKNKGGLNSHYKLMHLNISPFKCMVCNQTFGRADYLKKHLQTHEERDKKANRATPGKFLRFKNTEDPLPCKICGKVYNGINKLKVHLQTHVVVKRYQCEFCNLTYKRWPSLKRHEKTHLESDEYFHRCNVCWKRLKSEDELKLHMASHGNPKYQCHICDEQFHRKYLFDNHYLLVHATPEDLENSKKEIIYDTLLELSNKID